MINTTEEMKSCGKHVCTASPSRWRTDSVIPIVQSGADAASLVACICADSSLLPLFAVVRGSGGRLPLVQETSPDGKTTKVPLASYLGVGDEVHRRENPGFDGQIWIEYARFLPRNLGSTQPTEGGCPALKTLPKTHVRAHQGRTSTHPMPNVPL